MIGKKIRIERIINRKTGKCVIAPMDHGISGGPIPGIINMTETIDSVASGGANAVLMHKGMVINGHRGYGSDIGLIIHLSASTDLSVDPFHKVQVTSVEKALKLGADIVKTNYTGDPDSFKEVVDGCPVPVIIAGGPKIETERQLFEMVYDAIDVGGAGVAFGRNIFQAKDPAKMTRALVGVVHEKMTPDEALDIINE